MKFSITTLGCKVNAYESQYYAQQLEQHGFQQVDPSQPCDLFIVNSCTVTNTAASKSRQKIHSLKRANPNALCVVVGCYVQTIDEKERETLGADLIVGAKYKDRLLDMILDLVSSHQSQDMVENVSCLSTFESMPIQCFESKHRAFLKIQDGCNQFCSYCTIPFARGRERSLSCDEVVSIAKQLVEKGHSEIVLTGIHTGRYQDGDIDLTSLLKRLLNETEEHVYYRISSIEITEVSDALIQLMKDNDRICHHLHIPVQSACNETLQRMNRPYTIEAFMDRLSYIRHEIPDISVSTDVIVGFVQESDEEFEITRSNLEACHFSFLHVFPYSKRDGTKASKMSGHIPGNISKERAHILLNLSKQWRRKDMSRFDEIEVLIESKDDQGYSGYTNQYHPVSIHTNQPLQGRLKMHYASIQNETYIVEKEGIQCD